MTTEWGPLRELWSCTCGQPFSYTASELLQLVRYQHGPNPEAVIQFPAYRMFKEDGAVATETARWLDRIHERGN